MTNSTDLHNTISKAEEGLHMWGWDAAMNAILTVPGWAVHVLRTDKDRFPTLADFRVSIVTNLWRGAEHSEDFGVINGEGRADTLPAAFVQALADLKEDLDAPGVIRTDDEIWP